LKNSLLRILPTTACEQHYLNHYNHLLKINRISLKQNNCINYFLAHSLVAAYSALINLKGFVTFPGFTIDSVWSVMHYESPWWLCGRAGDTRWHPSAVWYTESPWESAKDIVLCCQMKVMHGFA